MMQVSYIKNVSLHISLENANPPRSLATSIIVGVGNCASSLVQGRYFYARRGTRAGLIHDRIGGYGVPDIAFVLAIDTDGRKVGLDLGEAIFAPPNCTAIFEREIPNIG